MSSRSFFGDFKNIVWKPTIIINIYRMCCGSAMMLIITGDIKSVYQVLAMPFGLFMMCGFIVILDRLITIMHLDKIPMVGLVSSSFVIILSLIIIVGDPIIYIVKKIRPSLVPIEDFKIFNFHPFMYVVNKN